MFSPGVNLVHTFTIPFAPSSVSKILVTYKANDRVFYTQLVPSTALEAVEDEPDMTQFSITFTQEQTLLFEENSYYAVQLNAVVNGARLASEEMHGSTGPQHYKGVIQ